MTWSGQEYVVRWVIRESGRIILRTRFRNRLMRWLVVMQVSLGVLQVALVRSLWMLLPFGVVVVLMCGVVWAGRADVRRARLLQKRAKEL